MPLPNAFAYDTETGLCDDGYIRNAMVQICSITAASPDEIAIYEGLDCFDRFFRLFEETSWRCEAHCYNLSYEGSWIIPQIVKRYFWVPWNTKRMPAGSFTVMEDPQSLYCIKLCNQQGHILRMTDDMKRIGQFTMKKAAEFVKKEFPDWFHWFPDTKEETEDYNVWFQTPEDSEVRKRFRQYARVDIWSQAMIAKWLVLKGRDVAYTRASNGLNSALMMRFRPLSDPSDALSRRYARLDFTKRYPPLDREMQDIVEESLLGGFVYGETGTHVGCFYHYDYTSSYPKEYANGRMFYGTVARVRKGMYSWERVQQEDLFRWVIVSFSFKLRKDGMPAINGSECVTVDNRMVGNWNKKMIEGSCRYKLMTESYWEELQRHYEMSDVEIHEIWVAKPQIGDFSGFIKKCYTQKSRPDLKGTMEREIWKADMNTGVHGKTITKTRRRSVTYPNGERTVREEVTDPEFCSLIGFTAMMNARERLLAHCRMLKESDWRILVCDTDSMVTDCPPDVLQSLTGWLSNKEDFDHIGYFETETDRNGKESFDTLKCWGLKRYCEMDRGVYRKSAFAGMHDSLQEELLPQWETDGREYSWLQKTTKTQKELYGKVVQLSPKTAKAENIWFSPIVSHTDEASTKEFDEMLMEIEMMKARNLDVRMWE